MNFNKFLVFIVILICSFSLFCQKDSVILDNGNYLTGEIKSMNKGILLIETAYSDADFKIEWNKIAFLYSQQNFYFTLVNGERIIGKLKAHISKQELTVITEKGDLILPLTEITEVKTFDNKFIDRVNASIDLGYSFTKANNLSQLSLRSNLGYTARKWRSYFSVNTVQSSQDDVEDTKRIDGNTGVDYFLPKNWFTTVRYTFLQNDEQQLNLRSVVSAGLGKYFVKTNKLYWGVVAGLAYNIEDYMPADQPDKYSTEGSFATELNIFNVQDFSLLTSVTAYPSITEKGRLRTDFSCDVKYDLPFDFYIGVGYRLNYDNQPIEGASTTDYVFQTAIGWSW